MLGGVLLALDVLAERARPLDRRRPDAAATAAQEYGDAVEAVRGAIERGDVYQVNLVQHLSAPFAGDPAGLALALEPLAPRIRAPFAREDWT
ncbi:MAG: hypothetical protein ACRDNB_06665, partial [Gaiellaceae bacterium]